MTKYRKLPNYVDAIKLTHQITIHTDSGDIVGYPGDWFVDEDREQYICKDNIFKELYEYYDDDY